VFTSYLRTPYLPRTREVSPKSSHPSSPKRHQILHSQTSKLSLPHPVRHPPRPPSKPLKPISTLYTRSRCRSSARSSPRLSVRTRRGDSHSPRTPEAEANVFGVQHNPCGHSILRVRSIGGAYGSYKTEMIPEVPRWRGSHGEARGCGEGYGC
jgi:hypothetical protein